MPTITVQQAFEAALHYHRAGQLVEAEVLYRQILTVQHQHGEAMHMIGVIARQRGQHAAAVDWIRRTIAIDPHNTAALANLGEAYRSLGRFDEAVATLREALRHEPRYTETQNNLGLALAGKGQFDEAIAIYRQALQLKPDYAEAYNNLGIALAAKGQSADAVKAYREALRFQPNIAEIHNNLSDVLRQRGQIDEAIGTCREAVRLKPAYVEAWNNLGLALVAKGLLDDAIAAYRRALAWNSNYAESHNNLGIALAERGQMEEAIAAYRRTIELRPDWAMPHNNLGKAWREIGQLDQAIAACREALRLDPPYAEAGNNLGIALAEQGRVDEAIAAYRDALRLKPDFAEAHSNLGAAFKDQGRLSEGITALRRALQLQPDSAWLHSNLIYTLHFDPDQQAEALAGEQQSWNQRFAQLLPQEIPPQASDPSPARRLRIGYVSPDFRDHVVGRNLLPLMRCHDRRQFEIICYSGVVKPDRLTEEFQRHASLWRNTVGVADEALAQMVRQDAVDILVDLSQHMAGNRLPVFARRPAPVQVSFAGYPATTGVEAIPWRITDRYLEEGLAPEETGGKEQLCRIDSFWCYAPLDEAIEVHALPALENSSLTFGCLNNLCKINERVLKLWARVLGRVIPSQLLLLSPTGSHRQITLDILERKSIDPDRVQFVEPRAHRAYLELYHLIDIALDPFPYNGHTTSLDALWMGVPVISLAGRQAISRAGCSQLSNIGLGELVASSEDNYVRIAADLGRDLPLLTTLRATLRARMESSPVMDAPRFAHNIEDAYRTMWRQWCAEKRS